MSELGLQANATGLLYNRHSELYHKEQQTAPTLGSRQELSLQRSNGLDGGEQRRFILKQQMWSSSPIQRLRLPRGLGMADQSALPLCFQLSVSSRSKGPARTMK
jgi:hypothetical protein